MNFLGQETASPAVFIAICNRNPFTILGFRNAANAAGLRLVEVDNVVESLNIKFLDILEDCNVKMNLYQIYRNPNLNI